LSDPWLPSLGIQDPWDRRDRKEMSVCRDKTGLMEVQDHRDDQDHEDPRDSRERMDSLDQLVVPQGLGNPRDPDREEM